MTTEEIVRQQQAERIARETSDGESIEGYPNWQDDFDCRRHAVLYMEMKRKRQRAMEAPKRDFIFWPERVYFWDAIGAQWRAIPVLKCSGWEAIGATAKKMSSRGYIVAVSDTFTYTTTNKTGNQ